MNHNALARCFADGVAFEVPAAMVSRFVKDILLDAERSYPVVGVTASRNYGRCLIDLVSLARQVSGQALVVILPDDRATWELARELSPALAAFNGYVRVWRPGLCVDSRDQDHPRFEVVRDSDGRATISLILLAVRHPARLRAPKPPRPAGPEQSVPAHPGVGVPYDPSAPGATDLGWWSFNW